MLDEEEEQHRQHQREREGERLSDRLDRLRLDGRTDLICDAEDDAADDPDRLEEGGAGDARRQGR